MGEKQKILSKLNMKEYIKDYKNDLELILDEKSFDEEAKSLLLSIFYKLENFYKDYSNVKKECKTKNEFIENYINIIKNKCKQIIIISPQNWKEKTKFKVEKKYGKIECIPNENILFYALFELNEKNTEKEKSIFEDFTNECVNYVLNKGRTINSTEIIRDFNGWSWNPQIDNNDNINFNLIYQNLLILFGSKFLEQNIGKANIIDILEDKFNKIHINTIEQEFMKTLYQICIIMFANQSEENYNQCLKFKANLTTKLKMLKNRKEDAEDKYQDSSSISKRIKKIDEMINNIEKLREEYQKAVEKNKKEFFCISEFVEAIENEKKDLLKRIKENNKMLENKKYSSEQEEYSEKLSLYQPIEKDRKEIEVQTKIILLQKEFLKCYRNIINENLLKKDYFSLVLELRYYSNVLYKKNKNIMSQTQINNLLKEISKLLINKMIIDKFIDIGFKSEKLNYNILKYIFKTKMIELNNLILKMSFKEKNQIEVEYYDGSMLENKESFEIPFDEEITNKKDKKVKVFKIV